MGQLTRVLAVNAFQRDSVVLAKARNRARVEIPHASIIELPGSSHGVFADRPEIIAPEMVAFFERVRRGESARRRERH